MIRAHFGPPIWAIFKVWNRELYNVENYQWDVVVSPSCIFFFFKTVFMSIWGSQSDPTWHICENTPRFPTFHAKIKYEQQRNPSQFFHHKSILSIRMHTPKFVLGQALAHIELLKKRSNFCYILQPLTASQNWKTGLKTTFLKIIINTYWITYFINIFSKI